MHKYLLLILLLCNSLPIRTIIVEHFTIDSIFEYIDTPNTLVIFDIDNTLATSEFEIGNDHWFSYLVRQKLNEGMELEHAINSILPTYFDVAFKIPLISVEDTTVEVLNKLNNKKIPTLALTSRSIHIADRTLEQLNNINIHLSIPQIKIPFIGISYGGCDERVKNFDPVKAEHELSQFKAGLLPPKKPSTLFSYICDWIYSLIKCFIPS